MSRIYLSVYLSAQEDILIMIIYLLTGRPDARKTHTQPGRPDFFFVAWNSLKYGENSYCMAYFYEFYPTFSQNRVKIGPKLFSSLNLQNSRPGGGGGGYSHVRTVRVCAARKPPAPPPHPLPFFGLGLSPNFIADTMNWFLNSMLD